MTEAERKQLEITACKVRMGVIEGVYNAKSGHPGGSLSAADLFTYLYFKEMNVDPEDPHMDGPGPVRALQGPHRARPVRRPWPERGFFPVEELKTLRHIGSHLQGHPNMNTVPGVDMSTGSLGQGISAACGMALAAKLRGTRRTGSTPCWATARSRRARSGRPLMFAAHYKLDNLCVIIDNNGLQIDGPVAEVMSPYPIDEKLQAFGFDVHRDRRPRLRPDRRRLRRGQGRQGQAHRHCDEDRQGQGRLLHGEPGRLARQGPQRRAV